MADQRDMIAQTLKNMNLIYKDVGQIAQMVEDAMRRHGFPKMGDAAITWDTSAAYTNPSSWLYRWFARVYTKDNHLRKVVGYCIHLGNYEPPFVHEAQLQRLKQLGVAFPFVNVSLLDGITITKDEPKKERTDLYNCLRAAGWFDDVQKVSDHMVRGRVKSGTVSANAVTYFVDLLALNRGKAVTELLVEPMVAMFNGEIQWVSTQNLPVIKIKM